eukprot:g1326.t1
MLSVDKNDRATLEVEVEVETFALNDLQNTMTNDPKVGLANIHEALDDLEEGEAHALLHRCCSRMAEIKRDCGKYETPSTERTISKFENDIAPK